MGCASPTLAKKADTATHVSGADWDKTFTLIRQNKDPVAQKLLTWIYVTETTFPIATETLIDFVTQNPNWPKLHVFRDDIEKQISKIENLEKIIHWFNHNPPETFAGARAYMKALIDKGEGEKAKTFLKEFWVQSDLDRSQMTVMIQLYPGYLDAADHAARLDRLLWDEKFKDAAAILPLVSASERRMAEARIALAKGAADAQQKVQKLSGEELKNNGVIYERARWRRKQNLDDQAYILLKDPPRNLGLEKPWFTEKNILLRRALEEGNHKRAYQLMYSHGQKDLAEFSQAEWLLGWISLKFLYMPDRAYRHFERLYARVTSALSRSRATYWLAESAAAMKQKTNSDNWHKISAQFPATFYGQISHEKLYGTMPVSLFKKDVILEDAKAIFEKNDLTRVIRLLHKIKMARLSDVFFIKLLDQAKTRADFVLGARLALEIGQKRYAVEANKQLLQRLGEFMFFEGYPVLDSLPTQRPERALVHAIIHRESMFDTTAISPVGARGMMQVMPATAAQVSKSLQLKYTKQKLTADPQYNIRLGAAYLQNMLDRYDGFYPLAIAAYNAGPARVDQWIKEFGDPRKKGADLLHWIEQIPIYETRNYVQRVMESYYIYKLRFGETPRTALAFSR